MWNLPDALGLPAELKEIPICASLKAQRPRVLIPQSQIGVGGEGAVLAVVRVGFGVAEAT